MINNDILRRLRYALNLNDEQMLAIFSLVEHEIDDNFLKQILAKEQDESFVLCRDSVLGLFLDGLIIRNRGLKEGAELPKAPKTLNQNEILVKLRIALEYKAEDMIDIMALVDFRISKSELSAFFRKPNHRNYKPCGDQVLRNFLFGLTKHLRPDSDKLSVKKMK